MSVQTLHIPTVDVVPGDHVFVNRAWRPVRTTATGRSATVLVVPGSHALRRASSAVTVVRRDVPAPAPAPEPEATTPPVRTTSDGGYDGPLRRITKREARKRWAANLHVGVANDRYADGCPGYAMLPSTSQWPGDFDAMVEASKDLRRPSCVFFSAPVED